MEFPRAIPLWGNDRMVSSMLLRVIRKSSGETEDVLLTSLMELRRGNPYRLQSGNRTIDVHIREWRARGFSKLVGKTIEYRLSKGVDQPKSAVIASTLQSDFPAEMKFSAVFDVYIDNVPVQRGLQGNAYAAGLMTIPPKGNDTFTVEKPFDTQEYAFQPVLCAASASSLTGLQKKLLGLGRTFRLVPKATYENLMPPQ